MKKEFEEISMHEMNGFSKKLQNNLDQHLAKINNLSVYRRKIEKEIDVYRKIIDVIKKFINEKGLQK